MWAQRRQSGHAVCMFLSPPCGGVSSCKYNITNLFDAKYAAGICEDLSNKSVAVNIALALANESIEFKLFTIIKRAQKEIHILLPIFSLKSSLYRNPFPIWAPSL
jgi:hypothetical protein